ncbi:MAG: DUF2148 domain-containing protein [Desulfarculaceae bacterium]|nr:DUF2148 domain-containing protein [Desulfarculaceae bacterium]MCF8073251.1 DUF2148 domain-containing protein [Desulfarculaceae bacterium]MCF8100847.1 DUF2148 domain-containing protein [Desulfarculaceae bacterium]
MNPLEMVAQLMALSASTAPKSKGEDFVQTLVVSGEGLADLAKAMEQYGRQSGKGHFDRDGANVATSGAVLLVGLAKAAPCGLDCGACGFATCKELLKHTSVEVEFKGPVCAYRLLDLGIALGSAVKTASLHNVDNRIMYRVGVAARRMGLVDWDLVLGVPLSASGKSPYFDRKDLAAETGA